MKLPRKGILIRLCIYVPIIAYLAWGAWSRYRESQVPDEPSIQDQTKDLPRRTFTSEDGKQFEVIEITPEQAEKMGAKIPGKADEPEPPSP